MEIKICGLTSPVEANYLNEANVNYAGFVFYPKSKRNIYLEQAKEIFKELDSSIKKVAVMVSPESATIKELQSNGFDILQIHKELSVEVLKEANIPIWYALNIQDEDEAISILNGLDALPKELSKKIEAIVVDAPDFGSGKPFNWRKSRRMLKAGAQSPPIDIGERRFVLAGGLNPQNVSEGISIFEPDIVDVSSGVEGSDGKDKELILQFAKAARERNSYEQ